VAAERIGMPVALLETLADNDRLLPTGNILQGLCLLLGVQPHHLVIYDPRKT
jgi:hypothetical protein